eukprot:gnl/TRDRNA2_/TRDRNA2_91357_c0_seq1.p2 gnl/TRDRNA2_/TRDRNA2_91357_c0~~gnl/TRDRNA2_/TRDRNA2_91357_c0_seq1.p2  ORF type:complete len:102 (+),score=6.83 gnl/TRDRNA2_/TRDRNA2_91357_c0_seq1:82-387(+)
MAHNPASNGERFVRIRRVTAELRVPRLRQPICIIEPSGAGVVFGLVMTTGSSLLKTAYTIVTLTRARHVPNRGVNGTLDCKGKQEECGGESSHHLGYVAWW